MLKVGYRVVSRLYNPATSLELGTRQVHRSRHRWERCGKKLGHLDKDHR